MTRTLHITIGTRPDRSDLEDKLGAIDAGDDASSMGCVESLDGVGVGR